MPGIVIVEDHALLAETLAAALRQRGLPATIADPLRVTGAGLIESRPDLVLLDLDLGAGVDTLALIAELGTHAQPVLLLTGSTDRLAIARALEQGALGVAPKTVGFEALVAAVETARHDPGWFSADRDRRLVELGAARLHRRELDAPYRRLTEREQGTLGHLAAGRSVVEIAESWVVSEATVRTHVRGLLHKLGVRSQLAAVAQAHRSGWFRDA